MASYIDLHIHSRFSRATSPALNPASLNLWAGYKGLSLIGTGDLTHPAWLKELGETLVQRDDGFYSLTDEPTGIRFVPTGEVSAIYKHDGRTRKIHLVIIAPDLGAATRFSKTLGSLGNVESDGRPILGLSAHNILEIALNTHEEMVVVPAHIWTPWFSLFGAKSGYDRLEDCFGDLSGHITALETGLSSDPAMNRLISDLDYYALISSSDAHSPDKLGREATIMQGELSWPNLLSALKGGPALGGTVEFFPEEGKYHLDGHLDCGPALTPAETRALGGLCPVCGKPVTVGVLHRVMELADRTEPGSYLPDHHLIPLAELLGQVFGQGPKTIKVTESFNRLVADFGSEYKLLLEASLADIEDAAGPLLRLAVERMRRGEISAKGGYDGQFGTVTAIGPDDRAALSGQGSLFEMGSGKTSRRTTKIKPLSPLPVTEKIPEEPLTVLTLAQDDLLLDSLDESQAKAVTSRATALLVAAGPGSGKTRVLVHRAAWLLREGLVKPEEMLMTTYTRKAAQELPLRLAAALPFRDDSSKVRICTLHALAYDLLKQQQPDWELASEEYLTELHKKCGRKIGLKPRAFATVLSRLKNDQPHFPYWAGAAAEVPEGFGAVYDYYHKFLGQQKLWDFDDLILDAAPKHPGRFKAVLVDEFQDLSAAQFNFIQRLLPPVAEDGQPGYLTAIGDLNQSIYGFRGANTEIFKRLKIYHGLEKVRLAVNYRSTGNVIKAGQSVLGEAASPSRCARGESGAPVTRAVLPGAKREAAYVVARLSSHLGLLKLGLGNSSRQDAELMPGLALNDIAILFRLRSQGQAVAEALDQAGLAWQMSGEDPLTATDQLDFTADKINLLTMHAAKGLEFKLVFIVGVEEGLCPYFAPNETEDPERWAEEQRLFYVAVTRAKDRLYLTRAIKRRLYGQVLPGRPSAFWHNIKPGLCLDITPKTRLAPPKPLPTLFD